MDIKQFAKGITFSNVLPMDRPQLLEYLNTNIPEVATPLLSQDGNKLSNGKLVDLMFDLCCIPKMSTYAIGMLINKIVRDMQNNECYVNIGVWNGFTLLAGMLCNPEKKCIGIDNFSEFGGPKDDFKKRFMTSKTNSHSFYNMDYKQYFEGYHESKIGFYFYDGNHTYRNQFDGLKLAEPFLADNAIIMIDDINWHEPEQATNDFINHSEFNYDILFKEKTRCNCHPTWWNGIMIIQKKEKK